MAVVKGLKQQYRYPPQDATRALHCEHCSERDHVDKKSEMKAAVYSYRSQAVKLVLRTFSEINGAAERRGEQDWGG